MAGTTRLTNCLNKEIRSFLPESQVSGDSSKPEMAHYLVSLDSIFQVYLTSFSVRCILLAIVFQWKRDRESALSSRSLFLSSWVHGVEGEEGGE